MKLTFASILAIALTWSMTSCIPGEHNKAPNKGKNLDDTRIYGVRGEGPEQLKVKYEKDETYTNKAVEIRSKFFPK